jgi:hypothetical protein
MGRNTPRLLNASTTNNIGNNNAPRIMKAIITILFTTVTFFSDKRELFYSKEEKCSFYFTTVTEHQLELREGSEFVLNIQTSDSRYKGIRKETLQGSFDYKKDTLILKLNTSQPKKYYPSQVSYMSVSDSLRSLKQDVIFPHTLKKTTVPFIGQ